MQDTISSNSFNGLTEQLTFTVQQFEREATPENLARIVTALGAYASFGSDLAQSCFRYVKQHPVRSAMGLGVIFFALKGIMATPQNHSESNRRITH